MPHNFVADSFHTKNLCSRLSSSEVRFYTENGRFAFLSQQQRTMSILRLIEKRVVDFLIKLFARCYGWGAKSEYRLKIGDFARVVVSLGLDVSVSRRQWRRQGLKCGYAESEYEAQMAKSGGGEFLEKGMW